MSVFSWSDYGTVTSDFGYRDTDIPGASSDHRGIDIVLNSDSIPAFISGTVIDKGTNSSMGNWLKIQQSDGYTATYMHMATLSPLSVGSSVSAGQTVGTQGSTGISSGKHLHYQIQSASGEYVNPTIYESDRLTSTGVSWSDVSGAVETVSIKDKMESLAGTLVKVVTIILVVILGGYLFMKAFDIKLF